MTESEINEMLDEMQSLVYQINHSIEWGDHDDIDAMEDRMADLRARIIEAAT